MQAEPSSPCHGGGSEVTRGVVTALECFLTNAQARAAREGDGCCVLGKLLQHSTTKVPLRSQAPFVHLSNSQESLGSAWLRGLRAPGTETAWSSPRGEGDRQGQPGMAQTALPCPSHTLLRGTSKVATQARIPNTSSGNLEGTHPFHSYIKTVFEFASLGGKPSLGRAPWMLQRVESLSEPHTSLCTPFLPLQVKDV